jgi:predicted RNase H-like HicB family nuclease
MRSYNAVIERDARTGIYVGYVPGWPGAHSQGDTIDELRVNLQEVVAMLLEDGEPTLETEFIGTQSLQVARVTRPLSAPLEPRPLRLAAARAKRPARCRLRSAR